jgi:hypothetical protein
MTCAGNEMRCPLGHVAVRLHDQIQDDVKDCVDCASCGCAYVCVRSGRWFEVPRTPRAPTGER